MDEAAFLERLRKLIGRECVFLRRRCRLIEIMADEGTLVLETRERLPPIQTDQYGQAAYRSNELLNIPVFGRTRDEISEDLMDLLACLGSSVDTDRGV